MCLPHCPTYQLTRNEGDSPRGRIALMQGLATGQLAAEPRLESHLDGCLSCRACELVCPALVPYGTLIDASRALLARMRPQRTRLPRLMAAVMTRPALRWLAVFKLMIYRRSGLQFLVRRFRLLGRGRLARLESLLPPVVLPRRPDVPATAGTSEAGLFLNCTSPLVEPETLQAAVNLLSALDCTVTIPEGQGCCGALHQHSGLAEGARRCAHRNVAAFANVDTIVGVASGCTAQLLDYPEMLDDDRAKTFAGRVRDVHDFIATHPRLERLRFRRTNLRVLLHTPCTLRNVIRRPDTVGTLLARIPGLTVETLDPHCCGAAGSYFLTQPEMADRLLEPKLDRARELQPEIALSSNVGCAMHLAAGLRRAGLTIPVWHPLRLLAQQLDG
jgi:glycolate oxidase iron-sulfur subunit